MAKSLGATRRTLPASAAWSTAAAPAPPPRRR